MADEKQNKDLSDLSLCNGTSQNETEENGILELDDDIEEQKEYEDLDDELDRLNTCLDTIENWNDSLNSRIKDFLETIQQERREQEANSLKNVEKMDTNESK